MAKKFYEYNYGIVNEMAQASTAFLPEYHKCFLIYAEDEKQAFWLAMQHIYDGLPTVTLHDIVYEGEYYNTVEDVIVAQGRENCCKNCANTDGYTGFSDFYCKAHSHGMRAEQYDCLEFTDSEKSMNRQA